MANRATASSPRLLQYVWIMRVLGVLYALGAVLFFVFPSELVYLMNVGPKVFQITQAIAEPGERFWIMNASAMLVTLSAISFLSAESPSVRGYALVHLLAKVATGAGFLYLFLNHQRFFAYLVGAIVDLPLALLILFVLVRLPRTPEKLS